MEGRSPLSCHPFGRRGGEELDQLGTTFSQSQAVPSGPWPYNLMSSVL
jgi:hypothetical protein